MVSGSKINSVTILNIFAQKSRKKKKKKPWVTSVQFRSRPYPYPNNVLSLGTFEICIDPFFVSQFCKNLSLNCLFFNDCDAHLSLGKIFHWDVLYHGWAKY